MKTIIYYLVMATLILSGCTQKVKDNSQEVEKAINNTLNKLLNENQVPGINLSIISKDGKQNNFSVGYADVENNIKLTVQHVLPTGSVGKTFAVAIIFQLVDEGKINLDDKIKDYFPEVEWLDYLPNTDEITIGMLLEHTSGLPRYVIGTSAWDTVITHPDKVWTYKDRMEFVFNADPVHVAGKGWAYSDTNYILLGMLIEKLTNGYYYDYLKEKILIPAGLEYTYANIRRDIPNLPIGYSKLPEEFRMPDKVVQDGKYIFNPQMEWTGGGIASTTPDLAKWAQIYYSGKLFSDSLHRIMIAPNENGVNIADNLSYGAGSFIYSTKVGKAYGHTGFMPGFTSIFAYFPDYDMAMALQINCDYSKKNMELINYLEEIVEVIIKE